MRTLLLILLLAAGVARGQANLDSVFVLPDSVSAFTIENFYATILRFHPLVKQAGLLPQNAQAEIRLARGAFDPKLAASFNNKEFNNKDYYTKWSTSLSLPTWFPVDPKVGMEQNSGVYIDPENSVPASDDNRQVFAGVAIPLGRGLFTDDRRATLKSAKLFAQISEAEKVKVINKILLEASKEYWQWYYSYYNFRLYVRNTGIAREIFSRVKLNAQQGELSAMDTVQASIILHQRLIEQQEAQLDFVNASIRLSNFLWDANLQPVVMPGNVAPVLSTQQEKILSTATLEQLAEQARSNHPELLKLSAKLDQLHIEKKLATEYLKPRLDLSYTWLNQPFTPQGNFQAPSFGNNYKFGLDFSIPVLLRKERAKLAQAKLKIEGTQYERTQAEREIVNQVTATFNQLRTTITLIQTQHTITESYTRLLHAELFNLQNGESDLFKINVQQEKLIQSQSKLLKLRAEYQKLKATLLWAAGVRDLAFD